MEFYSLKVLLPYLEKDWLIWECAQGTGMITRTLRKKGFKVIGTDILTGQDFFKWRPDEFDCIVANPPYSNRYEFLKRSQELNKPFALLLPDETECECERIPTLRKIKNRLPNTEYGTVWFTKGLKNGLAKAIAKNLEVIK